MSNSPDKLAYSRALSQLAAEELAPAGTVRAAINLGNPLLAKIDNASGQMSGLSVDLARELARRLARPLHLVSYSTAGQTVAGAKGEQWDIGFLAIDPLRAEEIEFTSPYLIIEGAYLVPQASPITDNSEVDRPGTRVVVGAGSAYDLYLTRELKYATIVRARSSQQVVQTMLERECEVAAGVRQQLQADMAHHHGLRLLDGRFMAICQAIATPKNRPAGLRFLNYFIEQMKADGFIAKALKRHHIEGVSITPPENQANGQPDAR